LDLIQKQLERERERERDLICCLASIKDKTVGLVRVLMRNELRGVGFERNSD